MTDRELLEAAVKASGLALCKGHKGATFDVMGNAVLDWHNGVTWNPLTDDGDALRLVVALGIRVEVMLPRDRLELGRSGANDMWELHGSDPHAATRRAIVRAAAAIGGSR